jgi:hypothetical protein
MNKIHELKRQNDEEFMEELKALLNKYKKMISVNFLDEK